MKKDSQKEFCEQQCGSQELLIYVVHFHLDRGVEPITPADCYTHKEYLQFAILKCDSMQFHSLLTDSFDFAAFWQVEQEHADSTAS